MKHLTLSLILLATPALATDASKPDSTPEPAASPERSREPSRSERSNECPHDEINRNRFGGCSAPRVSLRPRARPVTEEPKFEGKLK